MTPQNYRTDSDLGLRIVGVDGRVTSVQLVELEGVGLGAVDLPPFRAGVLELSHLRLGT